MSLKDIPHCGNFAPSGAGFVQIFAQDYRPAVPTALAIHPLSKLRGILANRINLLRLIEDDFFAFEAISVLRTAHRSFAEWRLAPEYYNAGD